MPSRPPERARPFDHQALALNTFASLSGAILSSALGASELGSLICAVIAPALTAIVIHPGPHRRRRLALVVALLALLHLTQSALARIRGRHVRSRSARAGGLRFAGLTACAAFAVSAAALTAPELVLGDALVSDRRLTLFPVPGEQAASRPRPTPTATPTPRVGTAGTTAPAPTATPRPRKPPVERPKPPPGRVAPDPRSLDPDRPPPDRTAPTLDLPAGITARATDRRGAVVRYAVRAADGTDGTVKASCRPASGTRFPVGTTTVRCTARDRAGNVAVDSFVVRVAAPPAAPPRSRPDPAPPTGEPEPGRPNAPETPHEPAVPREPDGPEAPDEEPAPEEKPPPREEEPGRDREPPVFTGPRTIIVDTHERDGVLVPYPAPPATDDRDGPVPARCAPAAVPAGSRTQVQCTARDRSGNGARATFLVWARIVDP